jgi:hypothetical protein
MKSAEIFNNNKFLEKKKSVDKFYDLEALKNAKKLSAQECFLTKMATLLFIKIFISVYFELPNTWFYSIRETVSLTNKINFFHFHLFLELRTALRQ